MSELCSRQRYILLLNLCQFPPRSFNTLKTLSHLHYKSKHSHTHTMQFSLFAASFMAIAAGVAASPVTSPQIDCWSTPPFSNPKISFSLNTGQLVPPIVSKLETSEAASAPLTAHVPASQECPFETPHPKLLKSTAGRHAAQAASRVEVFEVVSAPRMALVHVWEDIRERLLPS